MILDWLDRILARILPVHSREGGLHAREPGDVFDHSRAEVVTLPCHQPDPRWQLHTPAAVPLEFLEVHHPRNLPFTGERVPAAPVTPASARPETPLERLAAAAGIPDYIIDALGGHDSTDACVESICRRAERQVA